MKKTIIWIIGMILLVSFVFAYSPGDPCWWVNTEESHTSEDFNYSIRIDGECCSQKNKDTYETRFTCTWRKECCGPEAICNIHNNPLCQENTACLALNTGIRCVQIGDPVLIKSEVIKPMGPDSSLCGFDEICNSDCLCEAGQGGEGFCGDGEIQKPNEEGKMEECDPASIDPDEPCGEGAICLDDCTCGVESYCGDETVEGDEECDPPVNESAQCEGRQCLNDCSCQPPPEECNDKDDDGDGLIDEDDNCRSLTEGELNYCLQPDECPIDSVCGYQTDNIIVGQAGGGDCKICGTVCKTCPPHPPEATKGNPKGICKDYPFSKNCLDYLNMVSCGTCVDEDKDGKRETFVARKDDGLVGFDIDGKVIFYDDLKDTKPNDGVVDCWVYGPGAQKINEPTHPDNSGWGVCVSGICKPKECYCDCNDKYGYEKGKDKKGNPITPSGGPYVKSSIIEACVDGTYWQKYTCWKIMGNSWGQLLENTRPDCKLSKGWLNAVTCFKMNDQDLAENQRFHISQLQSYCRSRYQDNAYFYAWSSATSKTFGAYCYCRKANIELEKFPEDDTAFIPQTYSTQIAYIGNFGEDTVEVILDSIRAWSRS